MLAPHALTRPTAELQPHRPQRVSSRRAPHSHHYPARQSHHPLSARQLADRLLLRVEHHAGLHESDLLGRLCDYYDGFIFVPGRVWEAEWDGRGEADLSVVESDIL